MAELAASLAREHGILIVAVLFGMLVICVYAAMSVTHGMERRRMEQFDREFGRFQAASMEKKR